METDGRCERVLQCVLRLQGRGSNVAALGASAGEAEFGPEKVQSFEIGVKSGLLAGALQLSTVYFLTNIEDLQVAQFTGRTSFIVQNAAEAEVQGRELDGRWQLTRHLGLSTALAYTDFEFTSFPRAGWTAQQLGALRENTYSPRGGVARRWQSCE